MIFLWLGGGATHIETFNPIPYAPVERRSATGFVETKIPTVKIGGLFKEIAKDLTKLISSEVLPTKTLIIKPLPTGSWEAKEIKAEALKITLAMELWSLDTTAPFHILTAFQPTSR